MPVRKLAKGDRVEDGVVLVERLNGKEDFLVLRCSGCEVECWSRGVQLPAAVDDTGEESDFCRDGLVVDDETNVHGVCEIWVEVDADGDGHAWLAFLGRVTKDMDDARRRDDWVCHDKIAELGEGQKVRLLRALLYICS